mgnify:CR=1 FL=1
MESVSTKFSTPITFSIDIAQSKVSVDDADSLRPLSLPSGSPNSEGSTASGVRLDEDATDYRASYIGDRSLGVVSYAAQIKLSAREYKE